VSHVWTSIDRLPDDQPANVGLHQATLQKPAVQVARAL
jgi:hypothetical protein